MSASPTRATARRREPTRAPCARRRARRRATAELRLQPPQPDVVGHAGLMAIEGTVFALAIVMYFYLRSHVDRLADERAAARRCVWGTLNTVRPARSACGRTSSPSARRSGSTAAACGSGWRSACCFAVVFLVVRGFEFTALNVPLGRPTPTARSSGCCCGLHTTHLVTDTWDTAVLAVLFFTGPFEGKRFVDVSENARVLVFRRRSAGCRSTW